MPINQSQSEQPERRFSASAGIAIGPILFILAILALLAAVVASGGNDFQVAGGADRITADITAQANLIRSTINECNQEYQIAVSTGSVAPPANNDFYPAPSGVALVSALTCTPLGHTTTIWNDGTLGNKLLPQPTSGFNAWEYIDDSVENGGSGGGRCFWTAPGSSNPSGSAVITTGLGRAAGKFNSAVSYAAGSNNEVLYNPASQYQKFVVMITLPTNSLNSHCDPANAY